MFESGVIASMLTRYQEDVYAAQAPQAIARREFELLEAAGRGPRRPEAGVRGALARVGGRLFGGVGGPLLAGRHAG